MSEYGRHRRIEEATNSRAFDRAVAFCAGVAAVALIVFGWLAFDYFFGGTP